MFRGIALGGGFLGCAMVLLALSGCAPHSIPRSSLIGVYRLTYEPYAGVNLGTETLDLRADGTCDQSFRPASGKGWRKRGRWHIEQDQAQGTVVVLEDVLDAIDENSAGDRVSSHPRPGGGVYPVEQTGSQVMITINDDMGYRFRKVR